MVLPNLYRHIPFQYYCPCIIQLKEARGLSTFPVERRALLPRVADQRKDPFFWSTNPLNAANGSFSFGSVGPLPATSGTRAGAVSCGFGGSGGAPAKTPPAAAGGTFGGLVVGSSGAVGFGGEGSTTPVAAQGSGLLSVGLRPPPWGHFARAALRKAQALSRPSRRNFRRQHSTASTAPAGVTPSVGFGRRLWFRCHRSDCHFCHGNDVCNMRGVRGVSALLLPH